jgi:hypothetical protein
MTYTFRFLPEHNLVLIRWEGTVLASDIAGCLFDLFEDADIPLAVDMLWDCRGIGVFTASEEAARQLGNAVRDLIDRGSTGRRAFIGLSEVHAHFVGQVFRVADKANPRIRFFYSPGAAAEWLGIPPEDLRE